jgi:hypothetical protein
MEATLIFWVLITSVIFGLGSGAIANAKGRSFLGYFLLGFFLSFVGLLIAIGMPAISIAKPHDVLDGEKRVGLPLASHAHARLFTQADIDNFSDPFKLYLVDHYGIKRNEVLEKFVLQEILYSSLDEVLVEARHLYIADLNAREIYNGKGPEAARSFLEANGYQIVELDIGRPVYQIFSPDGKTHFVRGTTVFDKAASDGIFEEVATTLSEANRK